MASKVLVKTQETQNRLNGRKLNWHRLLSAQLLIKQVVHVKALRLKLSSLSDDVINAVPQSLRDAALGLGSTKSEAVKNVVLPAALSGIVASIILAVSRAVGETMIVVMAAGLAANLSVNPLDAVTTVTAQIVTILVGDQEFESAKTLSAFALALTLIVITLATQLRTPHAFPPTEGGLN